MNNTYQQYGGKYLLRFTLSLTLSGIIQQVGRWAGRQEVCGHLFNIVFEFMIPTMLLQIYQDVV